MAHMSAAVTAANATRAVQTGIMRCSIVEAPGKRRSYFWGRMFVVIGAGRNGAGDKSRPVVLKRRVGALTMRAFGIPVN